MDNVTLTTAEKTLEAMAKTVLILGIIGSIAVFFSSFLSWEISPYSSETRGIDGINWAGLPALIYCVMATLIAWSILSILVEISINIRSKSTQTSQWEKEFALMVAIDNIDKAKEILYRTIFCSDEFKLILTGGNDKFHQECIDKLNTKFKKYLEAIGKEHFSYSEKDEYLMAFKK